MGKMYNASIDEIAIVDGKVTGVTITDNFSSINQETKEKRVIESATFTIDGISVEEFVQIFWDNYKVKAQARTWKFMSDKEFLALNGGKHDGIAFIPKAERGGSSKQTIIEKFIKEQQTKFYNKALDKAMALMDDNASNEEIAEKAQELYNDLYAETLEEMANDFAEKA